MNRPIVYHTIALILGIFLGHTVKDIFIVLMTVFLAASLVLFFMNQFDLPAFIVWGSILFLGIGSISYVIQDRQFEEKFIDLEEKRVNGLGMIITPPEIREGNLRFVVKIEEIINPYPSGNSLKNDQGRGKILLYLQKFPPNYSISYGDRISFHGELQKPLGKRNPGGFDYQLYLKGKGITAYMYATYEEVVLYNENQGNLFIQSGIKVRNRLMEIIDAYLPSQTAGLLKGILLGNREGLSTEEKEGFRKAGLSHILAVSGMHVGFLLLQFHFLFRFIFINKRVANGFIILLLWGFVLVTGFQPSVLRAVLMASVVLLEKILRREPDLYSSIAFAAMILLILNPYQIFQVGFLLSFSATLGIVMFHQKIKNKISYWKFPELFKNIFSGTLSAQIGIFPIMAWFFNSVFLSSVIANFLVFPILGIVHFLGVMMVLVGSFNLSITSPIASSIATLEHLLLGFVLFVAKLFSEIDFGVFMVKTPSLFFIFAYIIFLLILYHAPKIIKKYKEKIFGIGVIFFLMIAIGKLLFDPMEVVFLDVGQGDAIFMRTPLGKTILIDGGGYAANGTSDMGKSVVIPFFHHRGIRKVDLMVSTHSDADHLLGLLSVLKEFPVKNLIIPAVGDGDEALYSQLENMDLKATKVSLGDIIHVEKNIWIEILHPQEGVDLQVGNNENSIAFKLNMKEVSFMLTGDIYMESEKKMIEAGGDLSSEVLKIAHHGSKTSTSQEFLNEVNPKIAVISVGRNNRYGHPTREVLDRLMHENIKIYRTDKHGAVILKTRGKNIRAWKMLEG
jgi:competence protein ComEC